MGELVTRVGWNAAAPRHVDKLLWKDIDAIVIHYSAAMADEDPEYALRVRAIQRYHMLTKGWNDIAYNYLVARDGTRFIGRGDEVMSAATYAHNDHTVAICFLGADKIERDDVTDKGREAFAQFIFMIEDKSGKRVADTNLVHPIKPETFTVSGHRIYTSTECPGAELMAFIATKGWDAYRTPNTFGYPEHFFVWAAWYLGEGVYRSVGPKHKPSRPKYPRMPVAPIYWLTLRRFLKARNKPS